MNTRPIQFPEGAIIRLQLKDKRPQNLGAGAFLWHEHLTTSGRFASPPGARMTDEEQLNLMVDELKAARVDGVGCIFDTTLKRRTANNIQYTREVALRSGLPAFSARVMWEGTRGGTMPRPRAKQRVVEELAEDMYKESIEQRWSAIGEIGTSLPTTDFDRWYLKGVAKL